MYQVGVSGVPIVNVNNNCSTGSIALYLGRQAILAGQVDCVLVVGFEEMAPGSLSSVFSDRADPLAPHIEAMGEHMNRFGTSAEQVAKISFENHKHSVNNPYAQFRDEYSLEQVMNSPAVHAPLTKLQCCPASDGAAATVLVSEPFARVHGLLNDCVEIAAMTLTTDVSKDTLESQKPNTLDIVGYSAANRAATAAYQQAGIRPSDVTLAEVHDCFSANELITYEGLEFCKPRSAGACIDRNEFTYGVKVSSNPSSGFISKGHPLGATGLAQCAELVWQLRGHADKRQVEPRPQYALQHNLGLEGAFVVAIYKKYNEAPSIRPLTSDPKVLAQWEAKGCPSHKRPHASSIQHMSK